MNFGGMGSTFGGMGRGFGPTDFNYYVDSVAGSDSNNGRSEARAFQTIAAVSAVAANGSRVGLKRGSSWREQLTLGANCFVGDYGSVASPMPKLDAADVAGAWSKTAGQTNIYQQTWTHDYAAGKSFISVWEDADRLRWQSSLANCDANPGSYYVATPSGTSSTVYVHPKGSTNPTSDGKTYEISKRLYGLLLGANSQARNIRTKRSVHHNGSLEVGAGGRLYGCIGEDGCVHNIFLSADCVAYDCIAWKADWADRNTITMFVAYTADGTGHSARYERCIAVQDPAKITSGILGFYCHTGATLLPWDSVTLIDCATYGVYDGASFGDCASISVVRQHAAATRVAIRSRISGSVSVIDPWLHCVSGVTANADAVFTQQDDTGYGVIEGARTYTDNSSSAGNIISNGGTGLIEAKRNVIVGDTTGGFLAAFGNSDATTPMNAHHNVIYGMERAFNALDMTLWQSDYNVVYPNTMDVRYGGSTYSNWGPYPPNDANTVTTDPGLIDPANGNFAGTNIPSGVGLERPSISYTAIPSDATIAAM